jgi:3-dehydroshikimate dehydratase
MLKAGVCSVTFRGLSAAQVVDLACNAGLDGIEWGGDAHVPAGNKGAAGEARELCLEAGIKVASYGSYFRVLDRDGRPEPFEPVLESALELGTDTVRIWAGSRPSDLVDASTRGMLMDRLVEVLDMARQAGVRLGLEFHTNTLCDSNAAALCLLDEIRHPALFTYWQPIYWITDPDYRLRGLKQLASKVLNLHVFQWKFRPGTGSWGDSTERRPLKEGACEWKQYLSVPLNPDMAHYALMEFVRNDEPEQFLRDAAVLKKWLQYAEPDFKPGPEEISMPLI